MGDGLTITGGANGVVAHYDDLLAHARLLDEVAADLGEAALMLARVNLSPDVASSALLCPLEAARAEEAMLAANIGPRGVATAGARAEASAAFLRFSVTAHQEVDAALSRLADDLAYAGGLAAGTVAVPAAVGSLILNPAAAVVLWLNRDTVVAGAQEVVYDQPWLEEVFTRAAPGVVEGGFSALVGGNSALLRLVTGGHWPTSDLQDSMKGLLFMTGPAGVLKDSGSFGVEALGEPHDVDLASHRFVAEVMNQQSRLNDQEAVVQVVTVQSRGGPTYIVQVPGTQTWTPKRGSNPLDATTNVNLVAGNETQMAKAVIDAMRKSGIPPAAPVMITGHSQGGIVAAAIASDPTVRGEFNIKAVVTAGSPIARMQMPSDVSVLSLEEEQDVIPKLDGASNPQLPNWVTATRDLEVGMPPQPEHGILAAHSLDNYVQTGRFVDESNDDSLKRWRRVNAEFFGTASAQQYAIQGRPAR